MKSEKTLTMEVARVHPELSEKQINDIVSNYNPNNHEAPIVLGHPKTDSPAYGWVKKLMKIGQSLFAEFTVVSELEEWLKRKLYKKRSIAVYLDDKKGASLRHIGFLGANPPKIKGMSDAVFGDTEEDFKLINFSENQKEEITMDKDKTVTYSEKQLHDLIEVEVQKKEKELTTEFAEKEENYKASIEGLNKKVTELTEVNKEFAEKALKAETESFVDKLLSAGKLAPAEKQETVELFMEANDSLREKLKASYEKRKKIIEFGENSELNDTTNEKKNIDNKYFNHSREDISKYADMDTYTII